MKKQFIIAAMLLGSIVSAENTILKSPVSNEGETVVEQNAETSIKINTTFENPAYYNSDSAIIVTRSGARYEKIKIQRLTKQGIVISHAKGLVTIPYQMLPDELRVDFTPSATTPAPATSTQVLQPQTVAKTAATAANPKVFNKPIKPPVTKRYWVTDRTIHNSSCIDYLRGFTGFNTTNPDIETHSNCTKCGGTEPRRLAEVPFKPEPDGIFRGVRYRTYRAGSKRDEIEGSTYFPHSKYSVYSCDGVAYHVETIYLP